VSVGVRKTANGFAKKRKMKFSQKFLIFLTSFRQHVLSLPVLFIILLSLFLIVPETSQSPNTNIAYYPQHSQYHPRIFPTTKVKLKVPASPANSVKHLEILQSIPHLSTNQLLQSVGNLHRSYFEKKKNKFVNERMRRIIMMFMQFESISRQIFNRGTVSLPTQTDFEGLADRVVESRWYREALNRFSSNNAYGFSEERMLRVLMSIHTAAHFFEVPYPTLFCLFFQESKFDFLADSATGAKGIGQLTSIGLREVQRLRNASEMELKLQKTAFHLNRVYTDPQIQKWLENLGFKINFAKISPIPEKIEFTRLSSAFMREVGKELVKDGQSYGENTSLLWFLSKRLRRGDILSNRFAHMHKVFSQMLEEQYARSQASAYNIETNILLSTILFSHYYRYRWRNNKQVFNLAQLSVICISFIDFGFLLAYFLKSLSLKILFIVLTMFKKPIFLAKNKPTNTSFDALTIVGAKNPKFKHLLINLIDGKRFVFTF